MDSTCVHNMSEGMEIRKGLLRLRMSMSDFGLQCGLSEVSLLEMLDDGEVSDEVRGRYLALTVEEEIAMEQLEKKDNKGNAVFCRPVRNDRIQVVKFDDGRRDGMLRKKISFQPRTGLPCEVEDSGEDDGWYRLVGKYRDNGVRLR